MKETLSFDWLFQEMGIFFLSRLEKEFFLLQTLPRFLSRFSFPEFAEFAFGTSCVSEYTFLKLANLFWRFPLDPKALLARPQRKKGKKDHSAKHPPENLEKEKPRQIRNLRFKGIF